MRRPPAGRKIWIKVLGGVLSGSMGLALLFAGAGAGAGALTGEGAVASASAAPSRTSYDKQANAICRQYNSKLQADLAGISGTSTVAQTVKILNSAVVVGQQGNHKLESLAPPAGEGASLKKVYAEQAATIQGLKKVAQDLHANNLSAANVELKKENASASTLDRQFDALGLTVCGAGSAKKTAG